MFQQTIQSEKVTPQIRRKVQNYEDSNENLSPKLLTKTTYNVPSKPALSKPSNLIPVNSKILQPVKLSNYNNLLLEMDQSCTKQKDQIAETKSPSLSPFEQTDNNSSLLPKCELSARKKEIGIKPQPPESLIKPLNLWGISTNPNSANMLNSVSIDMSASLPQLAVDPIIINHNETNQPGNYNSNANYNTTQLPTNCQSVANVCETQQTTKISNDAKNFQQKANISNSNALFSVNVSEAISSEITDDQNSQSIISINDYDENYLEDDCFEDEELKEAFARGMERSTTFPTTINELIHAETRVNDS